jgi:hypothetical protein
MSDKKTRVRWKVIHHGFGGPWSPGDVATLPLEDAERQVNAGNAEYVRPRPARKSSADAADGTDSAAASAQSAAGAAP